MDELDRYDALGLAELVRKREVSAEALLERAIARAEAVNPKINAVVLRHDEIARGQLAQQAPTGPFAGVPFLLKDLNTGLAGTVTTQGSRAFADWTADADTTLPRRAKAAGLVIFGKTASPEFGLTVSTESALWGATRNPWNLEHIAGGSSGGAAAAVAARIVPVAHASDGGGSIRIPAACCGLFGLKPSRGRAPSALGAGVGWNGLSTQHAVSISVRDSAALLDAVAGPEPGDSIVAPAPEGTFLAAAARPPRSLRIALVEAPITSVPVHADCRAALEETAALLEDLGHRVEHARLDLDGARLSDALALTVSVDVANRLDHRAAERGRTVSEAEIESITWRMAQRGRAASAQAYVDARAAFDAAGGKVGLMFERYDLILSPTLAEPPGLLGRLNLSSSDPGGYARALAAFSPYTALHNEIGVPAMSVPLHWNVAGLPIGVMFAAAYGAEALLFSLAAQLEAARPWADRRPPVCAA
jgi:amidase